MDQGYPRSRPIFTTEAASFGGNEAGSATLREISCNMLRSDRGCGAGEESGDRVRTKFIETMTRQSPEGA